MYSQKKPHTVAPVEAEQAARTLKIGSRQDANIVVTVAPQVAVTTPVTTKVVSVQLSFSVGLLLLNIQPQRYH